MAQKIFFLCIYAIAGVSSPNCGDKVEVQLLFMAFFINILYMPVDEVEFDSMKIALSKLGKKTAALVKIQKEGDCADKSKPDYPAGCELLDRTTTTTSQGGKRKSRKKRRKRKSRRKSRRRKTKRKKSRRRKTKRKRRR